MKRLLPLAAILLSGCATSGTTETPTAALNQTATVGFWTIKPIAVIEDSRCPTNVQCVWAGRLVLRTLTNAGAGADVLDLTLGEPRKMDNVGYLTLVDAQPARLAPGKINPRQYRFTFALEPAP